MQGAEYMSADTRTQCTVYPVSANSRASVVMLLFKLHIFLSVKVELYLRL